MHYTNLFHQFFLRISPDTGWVLQLVHCSRGLVLDELETALKQSHITDPDTCLFQLQLLGLVLRSQDGWKPTWHGIGVSNWRVHLLFAKGDLVSEPRDSENGHHLGPDCDIYRPTLFSPGYCWCCRPRHAHKSEFLKAAEELLRAPFSKAKTRLAPRSHSKKTPDPKP